MKISFILLLAGIITLTGFRPADQDHDIQFVCFKMHKASNTCYFNFTVDGAKFRHTDMGCKYQKKQEEAVKKVKEGTLALAREWKVECGEVKDKADAKEKKESF